VNAFKNSINCILDLPKIVNVRVASILDPYIHDVLANRGELNFPKDGTILLSMTI
jgi:hypothetical protein